MTAACRTCGAPLRWIAQYGQWYCDRCSAYAPAGPPMTADALSGSARRGTIAAMIGVGAVAAIGVTAALLTGDGGGGAGDGGGGPGRRGGLGSATAVIDAAVDALGDGDLEALRRLVPRLEQIERLVDCTDSSRTMREELDRALRDLEVEMPAWQRVRTHRGAKPPEPLFREQFDVGEKMGDCVARRPVAFAMYSVDLEYQASDGQRQTHSTTIGAIEIDGRWYLMEAGDPPESY